MIVFESVYSGLSIIVAVNLIFDSGVQVGGSGFGVVIQRIPNTTKNREQTNIEYRLNTMVTHVSRGLHNCCQ